MLLLTILFAAFLVPQVVKAVDVEGFYIGATGAANFATSTKRHRGYDGYRTKSKWDTGFFGAIDLGYRWCSGLHLEAEVAYRYNKAKKHRNYGANLRRHSRGHRDVWAAMVNVLYDINTCWCVQPYAGVGIGYAHIRNDRRFGGYNRRRHNDDNQFAYQVIVGVAYPICDNIDVAVEYRFFDTTTSKHQRNVLNNDIGVNMKYYF